jgi:hypothetical protein
MVTFLALVALASAGWLMLRYGWKGLWIAGVTWLTIVIVNASLSLTRGDLRQPWQRYSWDGWYWILFEALVMVGVSTLGCLILVAFFFAIRWQVRLLVPSHS